MAKRFKAMTNKPISLISTIFLSSIIIPCMTAAQTFINEQQTGLIVVDTLASTYSFYDIVYADEHTVVGEFNHNGTAKSSVKMLIPKENQPPGYGLCCVNQAALLKDIPRVPTKIITLHEDFSLGLELCFKNIPGLKENETRIEIRNKHNFDIYDIGPLYRIDSITVPDGDRELFLSMNGTESLDTIIGVPFPKQLELYFRDFQPIKLPINTLWPLYTRFNYDKVLLDGYPVSIEPHRLFGFSDNMSNLNFIAIWLTFKRFRIFSEYIRHENGHLEAIPKPGFVSLNTNNRLFKPESRRFIPISQPCSPEAVVRLREEGD